MTKYNETHAEADAAYVADTTRHIRLVQRFMGEGLRTLAASAESHDASKFREPERSLFAENMAGRDATAYGSPEYVAHLLLVGPALQHHYAHNRHHPEYHENGIQDMNLLDLFEMICDWSAAAMKTADGNADAAMRSIQINQKRFGYSDELAQIFRNTVDAIVAESKDGAGRV